MKRIQLAAIALAGCMLMFGASTADANSTFRNLWNNTYPDACSTLKSMVSNCTLCHTSVPNLNPYGSDLVGTTPLAIEGLDSDGDGYTNGQEIVVDCTAPGNASDHGTVADESVTWSGILALFR